MTLESNDEPKQFGFWTCVREDARQFLARQSPEEIKKKPSIYHALRLLFFTPGFQVLLSVRLQRALVKIPLIGKLLRRPIWYFTTIYFSCEIDTGSEFEPGIYIPHPCGIVIGDGIRVGRGVTILQGVTLGRRNHEKGSIIKVGAGTLISAGAKIIGDITIGENCQIGANAVVLRDVPSGYTAVGVPARLIPPCQKSPTVSQ